MESTQPRAGQGTREVIDEEQEEREHPGRGAQGDDEEHERQMSFHESIDEVIGRYISSRCCSLTYPS